jgi:hypothetical protein
MVIIIDPAEVRELQMRRQLVASLETPSIMQPSPHRAEMR